MVGKTDLIVHNCALNVTQGLDLNEKISDTV